MREATTSKPAKGVTEARQDSVSGLGGTGVNPGLKTAEAALGGQGAGWKSVHGKLRLPLPSPHSQATPWEEARASSLEDKVEISVMGTQAP